MKFPGQYPLDICMFPDSGTWCLHQYGLTTKFRRETKSISLWCGQQPVMLGRSKGPQRPTAPKERPIPGSGLFYFLAWDTQYWYIFDIQTNHGKWTLDVWVRGTSGIPALLFTVISLGKLFAFHSLIALSCATGMHITYKIAWNTAVSSWSQVKGSCFLSQYKHL